MYLCCICLCLCSSGTDPAPNPGASVGTGWVCAVEGLANAVCCCGGELATLLACWRGALATPPTHDAEVSFFAFFAKIFSLEWEHVCSLRFKRRAKGSLGPLCFFRKASKSMGTRTKAGANSAGETAFLHTFFAFSASSFLPLRLALMAPIPDMRSLSTGVASLYSVCLYERMLDKAEQEEYDDGKHAKNEGT